VTCTHASKTTGATAAATGGTIDGQTGRSQVMAEMSALLKALATSRPCRAFARRVVLPWALHGMRPAGEALEIGPGSGAMAAQLLSVFPELRIVATDYDPDMVATAQQTLAPLAGRASVQRADAADPPFADGQFDLVVPFAMLHHVVDWEQAIAEAVRVLRPGGRLVGDDVLDTAVSRAVARRPGRRLPDAATRPPRAGACQASGHKRAGTQDAGRSCRQVSGYKGGIAPTQPLRGSDAGTGRPRTPRRHDSDDTCSRRVDNGGHR
jgi:SAM-dependent methyltransferase